MTDDDKEYLMGYKLPGGKALYHNANIDVLAQRYMRLNWAPKSTISGERIIEAIEVLAKSLGIEDMEIRIAKNKE